MRASSSNAASVLVASLVLACASTGSAPEIVDNNAEAKSAPSEQRAPKVGDRAPAISLETLAGTRVELPEADADRAAVLIFGSFS